jgi:tetratricopeptide (TPR) repeat protein
LGVAEYKCKNNDKALHCLFDALSNRKRRPGNQLGISEVLANIGDVRFSNEDFMLASQFYTDCLSILLDEYGRDHQSVGEIYTKLGATRAHLQNFEEAKTFYQRGKFRQSIGVYYIQFDPVLTHRL